ncbi:MAG: rhodanese-like domain-containing protein [Planctomycetaceae bacterium]|nr:rhodanese-like domain-containing protein [Planctomycetaceae bacterium]
MSTTWKTISADELCRLCCKEGRVDLIDVRTPVEFREVHSIYARNVPLDALRPEDVVSGRDCGCDTPIYVICRSGSRGAKACEAFVKAGFTNVINVEGGTSAWEQAGLPVNRGKKAMSLERQVRIAAGMIVFAGSLAAFLSQNLFLIAIPAFVGAGLIFAGITDTCAMGMMIAKMPWNKVSASTSTKTSATATCTSGAT